jgi:nucleotide-binding universal stress UspA family protein
MTIVEKNRQTGVQDALVALARNETDEITLRYLSLIARVFPISAVHVVHVLPVFDALNALLEQEAQSVVSNYDFETDVRDQLKASLAAYFEAASAVPVDLSLVEGNPLEELLRLVEHKQADWLVVGKSSGAVVHGILIGNLVRKVHGNTLVVPEKSKLRLTRILVPVDFSPYSVRALQEAARLMAFLPESVQLIVVHLFSMPSIMPFMIHKTEEDIRELMEADRRGALADFIRNFAPEVAGRTILLAEASQEKNISARLLDLQRMHDADLIVMGARGHSKVQLLLMGSVTENLLLANESVPVLVVK